MRLLIVSPGPLLQALFALTLAFANAGLAHAQDEPLVGVVAGRPPAARLVAWSRHSLWIADAEGHDARRLALPGVHAAAVDDDGTTLVARTEGTDHVLQRVRPNGAVELVAMRFGSPLAAGAGVLAYADETRVHRSTDGGATFAPVADPASCDECQLGSIALAVQRDGTLVVTDTAINTCSNFDHLEWQRVLRARPGQSAFRVQHIVLPRSDYAAFWAPGAHGWLYGISYAGRLLAASGARVVPIAMGARGAERPLVATNGRISVLLHEGRLLRVDGARVRVLDPDAPPLDALALDARGRPLAITAGALMRFSRRGGWSPLALVGRSPDVASP